MKHEWPTGCLVFDETPEGNPVNVRNEKVVPLETAEKLYEALGDCLNIPRKADRLRHIIQASKEYRKVVRP